MEERYGTDSLINRWLSEPQEDSPFMENGADRKSTGSQSYYLHVQYDSIVYI